MTKVSIKNQSINFLGFHVVVATHEDLSFDVSITNEGLILLKLGWFKLFSNQHRSNYKSKFNLDLFLKKKIKFLGFHVVVLVKAILLMNQLLL